MTDLICVDCLVDRNNEVPAVTLFDGTAYCRACARERRRREALQAEQIKAQEQQTREVIKRVTEPMRMPWE